MKNKFLAFLSVVFFTLLYALTPSFAQVILKDPGIADGETLVYSEKQGKKQFASSSTTNQVNLDGKRFYKITSSSPERDSEYLLDPARMLVVESKNIRRNKESTVESSSRLVATNTSAGKGEILVADFTGLADVLRGLPFESFKSGKLKLASGESMGIDLEVRLTAKQKITVPAGSFECYRLEVSAGGIIGGLVGTSKLWFNASAPWFLVKSEGPSGGPGSPLKTIELTERR